MRLEDAQEKVEAFHRKMGFHVADGEPVPAAVKLLRARLIMEEAAELVAAIQENDVERIADGIGDLIYVTLGTAVAYDVPAGPVFDEVHASNMSKSKPNAHGKGGKGEGFQPPHVAAVLRAHKNGLRTGHRHHCGGLMVESAPGEYLECSLCG